MGAAARPHRSRSRKRLAQARARRDACARLADHPRQSRDQRDDRDRLHDARAAFAARARRRIARLLSLSAACCSASASSQRCLLSPPLRLARARRQGAKARDPPGAYFCGLLRRRRVDRSHRRGPVPARDRRAGGRRPGRRSLPPGFQWGLRRASCSSPRAAAFAALERPRPALIAGLLAVAFNALANYALIFGKLGMPALGIIGSGFATTLSQTLMCAILLGDVADRSAHAGAAALRAALAPRSARARGALAAWPADRRDDRRRSRRVRRRDAGDGPFQHHGDRGAHDRAADRLARLHGPARPRPGGDRPGRPSLWRVRPRAISHAGWSAFGLTRCLPSFQRRR